MKLRIAFALAVALVCVPALAQVNPGTSPLSIAKGGTAGATAAAARTNLGLAIGINVEAWNTNLDCLAALATNGVLQRTGSGTCAALTSAQLTALINVATTSLSGALPAWPNNTTTFFRGDGTYATLNLGAIGGFGTGVAALLGNVATGSGAPVGGTAPTISGPTFSGTILGTYTLGGTPSIAGSAINSGTVSGSFMSAANLAAGNVNGGVTGTLPVANGGTNCAAAGGACLDNITGFSGVGILTRTGAGAYGAIVPGTGVQTALGNATNSSAGLVTFDGNIGPTASGHATSDCALAGCTMTGNIAFSPTTDGITGTTANDQAAAGVYGEYISVSYGIPGLTTVTITIASPAVITWTGLPYAGFATTGTNWTAPIVFSTTGALPTGITAGTTYWVIGNTLSGTTFEIATSVANALAGSAINTSGSQSGTQSATPLVNFASSGTGADCAAMQLTAGDWDVRGILHGDPTNASTSVTDVSAYLSQTLNTTNTTTGYYAQIYGAAFVPGAGATLTASIPPARFNSSSTQTIHFVGLSLFTVSTMSQFCGMSARRER